MRRPLVLGLALLLAAGAVTAYWFVNRPPDSPQVGKPAPDFALRSLDDQVVTLNAFRGKPIIVNFWATWCQPCTEEMPALQAKVASHPDLVILGVDNVEPVVKVKPFVERLQIEFPVLLDQDGSVIEQYRVIGMPTSFFVDRSGVLRRIFTGALRQQDLDDGLAAIGLGA